MRRGTRPCCVIAVAIAIAATTSSRDARAVDRDRGAKWLVEVDGPGCASERATFEREVTLACDAVDGTCHVVQSPRDAELRATLHCPAADQPWSLELRTVEGVLVSRTELAGTPSDRLREAAIEVARDQAPERLLAADSLRDTLSDGDRGAGSGFEMPPTSIAASATGALGGIESTSGGLRGLAGLSVGSGTNLTLGFTGLMGGSGLTAARHVRTGLGLAWGAPFDRSIVGAAVEGGVDVGQSYQIAPVTGVTSTEPKTRTGVYGQGTVFLQIPFRVVRPYVGVTVAAIASQTVWAVASADLGLAISVF